MDAIARPPPVALEQRGNTLNGLRAFALKIARKPESGPDELICPKFARQLEVSELVRRMSVERILKFGTDSIRCGSPSNSAQKVYGLVVPGVGARGEVKGDLAIELFKRAF